MRKMKTANAVLLCLALLLSLSACGGKKAEYITVENQTGYTIADLRTSAVYAGDWGPNRLEATLYDTEYTEIALGDYTEAERIDGYSIQLFDEYDNSFAAGDEIFAEPGDTLTLFLSDGMLAWSLDGSFTPAWEPDIAEPLGSEEVSGDTEEYLDEDSGMRMVYPDTMTSWTDAGAIIVADDTCAATLRDVSAAYADYAGPDDDFLYELQTQYLMEDFNALFGDGTDVYFSSGEYDDTFTWSLAEFRVDLCNDSWHADAFGLLFTVASGQTVYKCFYAPYGDSDAMDNLLQNVRNYGAET